MGVMLRFLRQHPPPTYLVGLLASPGPQGWQTSPLFLLGPPPQVMVAPAPGSQRSTGKAGGSGEPACKGRAVGDSGRWDPLWVGRGVNSCLVPPQRPGPTLWEPECPSSGPQAAPGLQEHSQSSQITGPACWPPGSCPLQKAHKQITLKIDWGCPRTCWAGNVGVDGEPAMGGSPSHTLPFPRLHWRPP